LLDVNEHLQYIPVYVTLNSMDAAGNAKAFNTTLGVFVQLLAVTDWHTIETKQITGGVKICIRFRRRIILY